MGRILLTVLALFGFTACTTLQPLADTQPATIQQQVQAGDTVELERMDGTRQVLKVESVSADTLTGVRNKQRYQVPLGDIKSLSTRTMTTSDKIWTAAGVVAVIGAIVAAAGGVSGGGGDGGGSGY